MTVAQRNGQRIGSVIGTGNGFQAQQRTGHFHDLLLLGAAITNDRLLDLQRRIFINGHILLGTGQQNDPACMTDLNTGGDIGIKKQLLDGYRIRLEGVQQSVHILIDLGQPLGKRGAGSRGDCTVAEIFIFASIMVDHAVADSAIAGVDA